MNKLHPFYEIQIDDNDEELGFDFDALVDYPAHMKNFEAYGKDKKIYFVEEEKRRVTGILISANTAIYRRDERLGEHFVYFPPSVIDRIRLKAHREMKINNVNEMHDSDKVINAGKNGIYMIESFIYDPDRGMELPFALRKQGTKPGSWAATYQIENENIWSKVKDGTFRGFSIEGLFIKELVEVKKSNAFRKAPEMDVATRHAIFKEINKMRGI